MTLLSDENSGGLRVNISIDEHPTLNFTKCTVFCTDVNHYDDERFLAELEETRDCYSPRTTHQNGSDVAHDTRLYYSRNRQLWLYQSEDKDLLPIADDVFR